MDQVEDFNPDELLSQLAVMTESEKVELFRKLHPIERGLLGTKVIDYPEDMWM